MSKAKPNSVIMEVCQQGHASKQDDDPSPEQDGRHDGDQEPEDATHGSARDLCPKGSDHGAYHVDIRQAIVRPQPPLPDLRRPLSLSSQNLRNAAQLADEMNAGSAAKHEIPN